MRLIVDESMMGESFWRGYVDAITCLLLSLVLLMAILVAAIYHASTLPSTVSSSLKLDEPDAKPPIAPENRQKPLWSPDIAHWTVDFPPDGFVIAVSQSAVFASSIIPSHPNPDMRWRIWAYAEDSGTSPKRLAYMRLLAVRNLLISRGVQPHDIDTKLLTTADSLQQSELRNRVLVASFEAIASRER